MSNIDYGRFRRVVTRCKEIATEQGLPAIIAHVYNASAAAPMEAYDGACNSYDNATISLSKEDREANAALKELDSPYRVARSTVAAVVKVTGLPDTLKSQRTDTDKLNAIERLLDVIDDHAGQPWADELLQGDFGTKASSAIKEVNEAIAANKALNKAQMDRAAAYGPAYEAYLSFKRVVRDALGPGSKQYRRIHLLRGNSATSEAEPPANGAPTTESPPAEPTPAAAIS